MGTKYHRDTPAGTFDITVQEYIDNKIQQVLETGETQTIRAGIVDDFHRVAGAVLFIYCADRGVWTQPDPKGNVSMSPISPLATSRMLSEIIQQTLESEDFRVPAWWTRHFAADEEFVKCCQSRGVHAEVGKNDCWRLIPEPVVVATSVEESQKRSNSVEYDEVKQQVDDAIRTARCGIGMDLSQDLIRRFATIQGFVLYCTRRGVFADLGPSGYWRLTPMGSLSVGGRVGDTRWVRSARKQELPVWLL